MRGQQGFTLVEMLVAALLFAVSLLGLLRYQQALAAGFERQRQAQQAWQLAGERLEAAALSATAEVPLTPPAGWTLAVTASPAATPACHWAKVVVVTPMHYQVSLSRLLC